MHETPADLRRIQHLLDTSQAAGGRHLREVFTDDLRLTAAELCDRLAGVRILALATANTAGEPLVAPVDGILFRGRFHFGLARDSVRARQLEARPSVSATYIEGEVMAVVLHGRAAPVDVGSAEERGFRECLREVYEPRFGKGWIDWAASTAGYFRIEPRRMFASRLPGA